MKDLLDRRVPWLIPNIEELRLGTGLHSTPNHGASIMELVSYLAGEPWSAYPMCASPLITAFASNWGDVLDDETRQRLKPFAPRIVGTRSTDAVEERRAYLVLDWLIRTHTPAWLALTEQLAVHAAALRALPEIVDAVTLGAAVSPLRAAARDAAAARAAGDDAGYDVWAAIRLGAAGGAAAMVATSRYDAWGTADDLRNHWPWGTTLRHAAWAAARDAAWVAADESLRPTKERLQDSAFDLLDRLIQCK